MLAAHASRSDQERRRVDLDKTQHTSNNNKLRNTSRKVNPQQPTTRQRRGNNQRLKQFRCAKEGAQEPAYLGRLLGGGEAGAAAGSPAWRTSSPSSEIRVLFHSSGHFHPLRRVTRINTRKTPRLHSRGKNGKNTPTLAAQGLRSSFFFFFSLV